MREKDVNLPCRIFAILVMLFLLAPLVVIVIASFTPTALITFPPPFTKYVSYIRC